jgi:serine/threonine-protein kinase PknG
MTACQRPGCPGHYAEDGYCDECGHRAPASVLASVSGATGGAGTPSAGAPSVGATMAGGTPTGAGLAGTSTGGTRGTRGHTRGRLGANLVVVPPVTPRPPASAVLTDPAVPENQRYCGECGEPVGRGRDGHPGRVEGFCPRDRTRYNFRPKLSPGELVDDRYEILGALAHGGLGWIYLARDRNISEGGSDRWVVLKGLINSGDPDAHAAAVAERRFLVEVDHPNIVKIHDFAQHPDPDTGENVGYIVMEYVGGRSLRDLALNNRGPDGRRIPLPLPQVLAYAIEVLPAMAYLHERGLLFCDFKPDNAIHAGEQLKLIDLGAVRRMDDHASALYGTPGYQAPASELAGVGPSVGTDLYTVGRSMAVLSFDFTGFSTRYAASLPSPEDVPLLAEQESYYRLLRRSTSTDPAHRFASADEMADQATGVLREILSTMDGRARPSQSAQFTPERRPFGTHSGTVDGRAGAALDSRDIAVALPLPLVDPTDPAAGLLATMSSSDPAAVLGALLASPTRSLELALALVRARLETGDLAGAHTELAALAAADAGDWRLDWYEALLALAARDPERARQSFDAVYDALPGEPAAQLALAVATELAGDPAGAGRRYERVWRVDHSFVSAAFGLARTRLAAGDRAAARQAYDEVPDSSSQYEPAQIAAVRAYLEQQPGRLTEADLVDASTRLERLRLDRQRQATLAVEMFRTALGWITAIDPSAGTPGGPAVPAPPVPAQRRPVASGKVLGQPLSERQIRFGLERAYRLLAGLEREGPERNELVDLANSVRPRTVV